MPVFHSGVNLAACEVAPLHPGVEIGRSGVKSAIRAQLSLAHMNCTNWRENCGGGKRPPGSSDSWSHQSARVALTSRHVRRAASGRCLETRGGSPPGGAGAEAVRFAVTRAMGRWR